jgi:diaminobutyrate-2-oxoglutarate transaminase
MTLSIFDDLESEVRTYCRSWPAKFVTARQHLLYDDQGREYVDFFAGAGALNYGHNDPQMREALISYLAADGIVHSLDMATGAKERFLERFQEVVLVPRGLDYKVMFPGPTGTNAVEAALKLARKVKGREQIISFTNAFHGMTLGSLSVTGNSMKRGGAGLPLSHAVTMPFCGYLEGQVDTIAYLDQMIDDAGSGIDHPAGVITETVQAEGGLHTASLGWLQRLEELCRHHDMLLIVDDIQAGCGRTGPFFSFEEAGIEPDIVCLSKSLSGFGLPLSLTLMRRELDVWEPGEHNGTFRGHNPAFVTGTVALERWETNLLSKDVAAKAVVVSEALGDIAERYPELDGHLRGRGLLQGLACADPTAVARITAEAFRRGLVLETSGPGGEVLKILPPLTIPFGELQRGLGLLEDSVAAVIAGTDGEGS